MNPEQTNQYDAGTAVVDGSRQQQQQQDHTPQQQPGPFSPNPTVNKDELVLYHAPNTRSAGARILLEELGVPYRLHVLNMKANEQRGPAFLAVNPMGKVPALVHQGVLITEQAAVYLYLADMFPQAGLAPAVNDVMRGAYLRWMVFYGSCFEPALIDQAMKREPGPPSATPYGDAETTIATISDHLEKGPYILGDRMTAVDILWGTSLQWVTRFKLMTPTPAVQAYIDRMAARPSFAKIRDEDAALSAQHASEADPQKGAAPASS